ncbi:MAG: exodeoxyribonuclease III [Burkholderiales bacterium]
MLRIATWNVNSLKVRLSQVLDWLPAAGIDIACLQETKLQDFDFPFEALQAVGYQALAAGQKTYNGVAIVSRRPGTDVVTAIPGCDDAQKRVLAATFDDVRVICLYVPNGESVTSDKYRYKLDWLAALTAWLAEEAARYPKLAVLGDYNIAPEPADVHDPRLWDGQVLFSEPERAAFRGLLATGLCDAYRLFPQPEKSFTWWDYRMNAFRRNLGLRIDHILLSPALAAACGSVRIERGLRALERPSDHAPVVAELGGAPMVPSL